MNIEFIKLIDLILSDNHGVSEDCYEQIIFLLQSIDPDLIKVLTNNVDGVDDRYFYSLSSEFSLENHLRQVI